MIHYLVPAFLLLFSFSFFNQAMSASLNTSDISEISEAFRRDEVKTFTTEKTQKIQKRAQDLKNIIIDYENYCEKGCLYQLSNVEEMRVLKRLGENQLVTWTYINAMKETKTFSLVKIQEVRGGVTNRPNRPGGRRERINERRIGQNGVASDTALTISSSFPMANQVQELKREFGLEHDSLFGRMDVVWTLREFFDSRGNFSYTQVDYNLSADSDARILRTFGKKAQKEMEKTADQLFNHLAR